MARDPSPEVGRNRRQCQARFSDMRSALVLDAITIGAGVATGGGSALLAVGARASLRVGGGLLIGAGTSAAVQGGRLASRGG